MKRHFRKPSPGRLAGAGACLTLPPGLADGLPRLHGMEERVGEEVLFSLFWQLIPDGNPFPLSRTNLRFFEGIAVGRRISG